MSCPHSLRSGPCSQCIPDVVVQRVEQQGAELVINGEAVRSIEPQTDPHIQHPRRQRKNRGKR